MGLTAYKMETRFAPLPDFDADELWDALEAIYGEPTGTINQDYAIFTVDADYVKEALDDADIELTARQREILTAIYRKAKRHKFGVFDITFG